MDAIEPRVSDFHPFERAGFGHAPYRFAGYSRQVFRAHPDAPPQCGTSCDYCGTGIMDVFRVRSADGVEFKVGSDCIAKVYAEFKADIPRDMRAALLQLARDKREAKRQAAEVRLRARVAAARATLAERPALLTELPHPHAYHAGQGKTRRDYAAWLLDNAWQSGQTDACRMIERAAAQN